MESRLLIVSNILVFDVIFLDQYGALASATIYTPRLFLIRVFKGERVRDAFRALVPERAPWRVRARMAFGALALMGALFAIDQGLVNLLGHGEG